MVCTCIWHRFSRQPRQRHCAGRNRIQCKSGSSILPLIFLQLLPILACIAVIQTPFLKAAIFHQKLDQYEFSLFRAFFYYYFLFTPSPIFLKYYFTTRSFTRNLINTNSHYSVYFSITIFYIHHLLFFEILFYYAYYLFTNRFNLKSIFKYSNVRNPFSDFLFTKPYVFALYL